MPNMPTRVSSLSASATTTPGLGARQLVAGEARLVVVFDGEGDVVGQAIVARVVATHDALQLGELAHHVGHEVGLGQARGQQRRAASSGPPSFRPMVSAMAQTRSMRSPCVPSLL